MAMLRGNCRQSKTAAIIGGEVLLCVRVFGSSIRTTGDERSSGRYGVHHEHTRYNKQAIAGESGKFGHERPAKGSISYHKLAAVAVRCDCKEHACCHTYTRPTHPSARIQPMRVITYSAWHRYNISVPSLPIARRA